MQFYFCISHINFGIMVFVYFLFLLEIFIPICYNHYVKIITASQYGGINYGNFIR